MNTLMIQHVLMDEDWYQRRIAEDWCDLTPLFDTHVNPYGIVHLDVRERCLFWRPSLTRYTSYKLGNTGLDVFVYDPDALVQTNILQATSAGYTQINLTWVYYAHNATEFRLERSPNGASDWSEIAVLPVGTTNYSDTMLTDGTPYYYLVRAYRANGMAHSAYSNIASATTSFYPLAAPSNLIANNLSGPADLTWEDVNTNETEFRIERTSNGVNWVEIGMTVANTVIYRDSNMTCSMTYQYRIRAYRESDLLYSPYSNSVFQSRPPFAN